MKQRPNLEEPKNGRLFFYIEEKRSIGIISNFDLLMSLTLVLVPRGILALTYQQNFKCFSSYVATRKITTILLVAVLILMLGYVAMVIVNTDPGSVKRNQTVGFFIMAAFLAIILLSIDLHMTVVLDYNLK